MQDIRNEGSDTRRTLGKLFTLAVDVQAVGTPDGTTLLIN